MKKLMIACVIAVSGCASVDASKLNYGQPPSDYKASVQQYLNVILKDPYSAHVAYVTKNPPKQYVAAGMFTGVSQTLAGYGVCFWVNSKNSYGGYTGDKLFGVLIKDDVVVWKTNYGASVDMASSMTNAYCNSVAKWE